MQLKPDILTLINTRQYIYDPHFYERRTERKLYDIDVDNALKNGEVIEHVESYERGDSYIVFCNQQEKVFHIIIKYNNNALLLKTIYVPNGPGYENKFKEDLKTRNKTL